MEQILGLIGGALYYVSWMVQVWETKRNNKVTFSKKFFFIRILASIILIIEAIRISSLVFFLLYLGTAIIMIYNLIKIKLSDESKIID